MFTINSSGKVVSLKTRKVICSNACRTRSNPYKTVKPGTIWSHEVCGRYWRMHALWKGIQTTATKTATAIGGEEELDIVPSLTASGHLLTFSRKVKYL